MGPEGVELPASEGREAVRSSTHELLRRSPPEEIANHAKMP